MSALRVAIRDTGVSRWAIVSAMLAGTMALGSAVALSAVAAWLIARAAQMPSPADLALAAVMVRFFGISRGLFRYIERLLSHDAALRGVVRLRETTYDRLASSSARTVLSLRRGDIVARAGADLDAVGDAVVRAVIPVGVAVLVSAVAVGFVGSQLPLAGVALAAALVLAGVVPALLTARAARIAARAGVEANAAATSAALAAIENAAEHRVWDDEGAARVELERANRGVESAHEAAAGPSSLATASQTLFSGVALIACVWLAVRAGEDIGGPAAAIVALTPLAAFEAVGAIPAAIMQYFRSGAAAERLAAMADEAVAAPDAPARAGHALALQDVVVGWPGAAPTAPISATVNAGECLAVVGRSGVGKTTLLLTIAGALPQREGTVMIGDAAPSAADAGHTVALTLEDAHVFGTTVLENLRVARGDVTEEQAWAALERVGLAGWVRSLPRGLDTELGTGGHTVSGGERRRLLLARADLAPAPVHLLDEPGEHLDSAGLAALAAFLDDARREGRTVVVVTHDDAVMALADRVVSLDADQ